MHSPYYPIHQGRKAKAISSPTTRLPLVGLKETWRYEWFKHSSSNHTVFIYKCVHYRHHSVCTQMSKKCGLESYYTLVAYFLFLISLAVKLMLSPELHWLQICICVIFEPTIYFALSCTVSMLKRKKKPDSLWC